jgi:AAA domain/Bifunctional DNA primase/polymerase, N-terminal/Primase C terminal 1 (PriCT-1)
MTPLEVALQLGEEWSIPVFPCAADKSPLTPHGFKDASCNIGQIVQWWQAWPDALVGVPCGEVSKLLVVDIDPDGLAWYRTHHLRLACGRVHRTPRGMHLVYAMPPEPIACSTSKLARGVDVRSTGGYAVWWAAHGYDVEGSMLDIGPPPPELLERLRTRTAPPKKMNGSGVPEGERNASLTSLAGRMRRAGASEDELLASLSAFNERRCNPPLPMAEIETIAHSVARYAPHSSAVPPPELMRWLKDVTIGEDEIYLIAKLLPSKVLIVLYGAPGSGKSTLVLSMAHAIAHGLHWREFVTTPGLVVYLAGEGRIGVERRLVALMREHPELKPGPLVIDYSVPNLREQASTDRLLERIKKAQGECGQSCVLIIVDTLSRHLYGSDSDPKDMGEFIASVDRLRRELDCAVLVIHHSGKDATRGARGHSMLLGATDTEIEVSDSGLHWVTTTKQRDIAELPPLGFDLTSVHLAMDRQGEPITAAMVLHRPGVAPPRAKPKGAQQAQVMMELERRRTAGEAGWTDVDIKRIAIDLGISKTTAYAMGQRLLDGGFLRAAVGGYVIAD